MIVPPTNVRVLIATKPVDFRKGAMGLAAIVEAEFKADPFSGVIYVFRSKRADRIKLLFWDGTGVCLLIKRLEGSKFRWPKIEDGVCAPASLSQSAPRGADHTSALAAPPSLYFARIFLWRREQSQTKEYAALFLPRAQQPQSEFPFWV